MIALEALREACLTSPRTGEWSSLTEINSTANMLEKSSTITHSQLMKLVKSDVAESAFIEGQTMWRTAGQAIREHVGGEARPPYEPPEGQDGYPDTRGGKPEGGGKDDWWDYDQPRRGNGEESKGGGAPGRASGAGIAVPIPLPDISQMMT